MNKMIAVLLLFICLCSCGKDGIFDSCNPGDMRCESNVSQMCNSDSKWENYQDCGSIGETCTSSCSGYSGITCCTY
jgi:hypothetical protein